MSKILPKKSLPISSSLVCSSSGFDIFDLTYLFDHMFYLNRLRQLGVFCHVNSTFCGLFPLKDCKGSDRQTETFLRNSLQVSHTQSLLPPCQKNRTYRASTPYGELPQFLFLYIKYNPFQVKPFVAYTTCDLGSCAAPQTLRLFDFAVSCV